MEPLRNRATPAGGAWKRGWGRVKFHTIAAFIIASVVSAPLCADPVTVPSGQPVEFLDMIWDQPGPGLFYRYRFVAPEIGQQGREFSDVAGDLEFLCNQYALPRVAETGPQPSQIVISLSSAPLEFGQADPDIVQFFEAYSVENGRCIWEVF
ncbi:DUF6497 family protein [Pseudoprimorskyibacter insulae]|nr:DUF6497 family protein [Pseudoprimorskyibacter insulae]